jgi:Xaa-Pro aminopeptidase
VKHAPTVPELFRLNRANLAKLLPPGSLAVVNANDLPPVNGDAVLALRQNSDLFYLTGIGQEDTVLLLFPDAHEPNRREILLLRRPDPLLETWEGRKLTREEAREISGVAQVEWLPDFPPLFHRLMCECSSVWLNSNEHPRASVVVESRDARFAREARERYPLHEYRRLATLLRRLRAVKSGFEVALLREACEITEAGFRRVCRFVKPGVNEREVEAEFAHEFIRRGAQFAYDPIIAGGPNACALHYTRNDQPCRKGDLLLLDVGASHANYNADMTRTIPVGGRFTRRQRRVYDAVLRVLRAASRAAVPGKTPGDWQKEAEALVEGELAGLGLLSAAAIKKQNPDAPAFRKYFMHGIGHPLGLDVHDLAPIGEPIQAGWVLTVEPAIYIREEGFGVRLENNILVGDGANVDLMERVPIEAEEVEQLMRR